MKIEFDPVKNEKNIRERGLSFEDVALLDWDQSYTFSDERRSYGEARFVSIAPLADRLHVVCYTLRETKIRVVSFRKANAREERIYAEETKKAAH